VEAIDPEGELLRYFHGTGLHQLEGEDYRGVFRLGRAFSDDVLPPYTELVRFDLAPALTGEDLRAAALEAMRGHLAHRPRDNPFERFAAQLERDLPRLLEGDAADYHDYAFATARMVGSAFEVAASHAEWVLGERAGEAAAHMREIVEGSKVLSFRLARRRAFDPRETLTGLATSWDRAMGLLDGAVL